MTDLTENTSVRQRPEEGFRRWFINDFFDVILWYDRQGGTLTGYQVCYGKNQLGERAFSRFGDKIGHHLVSSRSTEAELRGMQSAILHDDGGALEPGVLSALESCSSALPQGDFLTIQEDMQKYRP